MTEKETEGERGGGERGERERKHVNRMYLPNQNIQYWTNPMSQT